jgi:dienelactone hydrolase
MYVPVGRTGPRPGVVVMHAAPPPGPVTGARIAQFEIRAIALRGAVVIGIDAPYTRRTGAPLTVSPADRSEHIRLMKDLQRAVDVLIAQPNVDPARIGFTGFSYGGMVAFHFAGIERRVKAGVITAGYGGLLTKVTDKNEIQTLNSVPCGNRNAWFGYMIPIEGIRYISGASPTALLFQIARLDVAVLPEDAQAAYDAAPGPKEVLYYDTGHGFNPQANADRWAWLAKQIGIDP